MLARLSIRNFAIIDRLDLEWQSGFNVITGETGAGKSIIVDAMGALLGDKLGPEVVRTGADRAVVEGVFQFDAFADLSPLLDQHGLEVEDGLLIVTREIAAAGGRGGARINGRTVTLATLQDLGEQLVDVHGQSAHMGLLRAREQLEYLDRYAGLLAERTVVAELVRQLRATRDELRLLRSEERQAAREHEMLRHEVAEIERAALREDEERELQAQRTRLQHVERLRQAATAAYQALSGHDSADVEQPGAVDLLGQAVSACDEGARFDPKLAAEVESVNTALALADETARSLRRYLDELDADPAALEQIEERLFAISALKRKYGDSIAEVLAFLASARERLDRLEHRDERLAELEDRERQVAEALGAAAAALSSSREAAGRALSQAVERELADLHMRGTSFEVAVAQADDPGGVPLADGRTVAFDLSGVDRVEFLIAANPGEQPRPMARIASGGELARIALALKTILSRADTRATLIFDEVDVGVGGRTAPVVGEKLAALAASGHQVLCVTHMPQVAAYADQHFAVAKQSVDGRTRTQVTMLDPPARIEELASMLAGAASTSARESAREMLERANRARQVQV